MTLKGHWQETLQNTWHKLWTTTAECIDHCSGPCGKVWQLKKTPAKYSPRIENSRAAVRTHIMADVCKRRNGDKVFVRNYKKKLDFKTSLLSVLAEELLRLVQLPGCNSFWLKKRWRVSWNGHVWLLSRNAQPLSCFCFSVGLCPVLIG